MDDTPCIARGNLLHDTEDVRATTADRINLAGPAITVLAGYCASSSPFGLIFVGQNVE